DYHDPEKRSIANALTIYFKDGTSTEEIAIEYPVGHKRRREEGLPLLVKKYRTNLARIFTPEEQERIVSLTLDYEKLSATPVNEVLNLFVKKN
ncbi:MAG: 2-methylcitrate dehydratase, partial [Actinomycetota bacterium]